MATTTTTNTSSSTNTSASNSNATSTPVTPVNLPPANFKELSILQLVYELQKYPKKEPSAEWERVLNYTHKVHSMYLNRFNLNYHDFDLLNHSFSNYFNGIVNVWIQNDESLPTNGFIIYLQLILKICMRIRRLRICNKSVTRHTVPPDDINKCVTLQTMVFESCTFNEVNILKYTNLIAVHLLNCEITGVILTGHLKKIRLIRCKCNDQNQLGHIISTRVIKMDQLTNELRKIDLQEALEVANELPTKDVLLYRLDVDDEFILEMENFVKQNGPFIGHMIKPLLRLETPAPNTVDPNAATANSVDPNAATANQADPNAVNPNLVDPTATTANQADPNVVNQNLVVPNAVDPNLGAATLRRPPQPLHGTEDFLTYKPLNF